MGAALAFAALSAVAVPPPAMPHPAPNAQLRAIDNASCERCHTQIAAEWRQSLHRASFTDKDFQRAIGIEPEPFCKGCHAPERDAAIGVACVTCHVPERGAVLAAPGAAAAPHPLTRSAAFATEAACARCHEFDFPDAPARRTPLAMQRTLTEHRGRTDTCTTCHMTKRDGHVDHRFAASRDAAVVESAVDVRATRGAQEIRVTLTPAAVGHAFPTGDLFRRIRVSVGGETRFLTRHFRTVQERPGIVVRSEVADDRVLGGPREIVFPAGDAPARVRVVYERAEGPSDPPSARAYVAGAVVLFDREL